MMLLPLDNNYDNGSFYLSKTDDGIDVYIYIFLTLVVKYVMYCAL